ncbi:MAG TPA: M56 family metallopeptidase [Vicinamibacterales bacterium]|nr:M56 family metallopeptidase [Vicinamibacterales bacterium]
MNDPLIVTFVDASIRSAAAVALIALVLAALRVRSGALRHAAWTVAVAAMLLMPLLVMIVPAVTVPAPALAELVRLPEPTPPRPLRAPSEPADSSSSLSIAQESPRTEGAGASSYTPAAGDVTALRWPAILVLVYAAGAIILLLRLAFACRRLHVLRSSAHPIAALPPSTPGDAREIDLGGLLESPRLSSPVTLGFLRPQIVLPDDWRDWPAHKLRLAISHERAHVARRDPLSALLAQLNCCVFWFHPLAWWLERRGAAAAEHACDDEAMRAAATPTEYASVLLDFARTARGAGGRIAWEGVGMGGGALERRIDRVLRGQPIVRASARHRMLVAVGCLAAIFVAVACRQEQPKPAPLRQNPAEARQQAISKELSAPYEAARKLTWEQVAALEADWQRNPENLATLETLLIFYAPDFSGKPDPNADRKIAARRRLILWLIDNHPKHWFFTTAFARIFAEPNEWLRDPDGYETAKKLWLKHAAAPGVSSETLSNAAAFLDVSDKPIAERLLLQAKAADDRPAWSERLGTLYAQVIVGSSSFTLNNVVRSVDVALAKSTYAQGVRRRLDASTDAGVLASAGYYLIINASSAKTDFDHVALGRGYLERALKLDPQSRRAQMGLDHLKRHAESQRQTALLRGTPRDAWLEAIKKLPDSDQLRMLTRLANDEYMTGESQEWRVKHPDRAADATADAAKNREFAQSSFQRSKLYAREALDLAAKLPDDPYYPDALFQANLALGAHAFREGDRQTAVRYMLAASRAPRSRIAQTSREVQEVSFSSLESRLIGQLLKHGERDTVIQYFERLAQNGSSDAYRPRKAAQDLRDGYWPTKYGLGAAQRD